MRGKKKRRFAAAVVWMKAETGAEESDRSERGRRGWGSSDRQAREMVLERRCGRRGSDREGEGGGFRAAMWTPITIM